jgi:hypothetical protein
VSEIPEEAYAAAAEALAVHRWKSMGVASAECECGTIVHGDADPFPADEAFRAHLASEILQAAAPSLLAAEVSAHRAEQDAVHADLSQLLRVLGMGDHARPQSGHEVMLEAISEVGKLRQSAEVIRADERDRFRRYARAMSDGDGSLAALYDQALASGARDERERLFTAIRHKIPLSQPWRGEALDLIYEVWRETDG